MKIFGLLQNVFYCTALAKVNITFGEYQGVYENIDEVDIKNVFLKNAAAGHRRPEFRRFSHLKLMMSVMLGSGALASKFTEYGCHCLLGPDVVPAPSRVPAVDVIDETCRRHSLCQHCAKIDNDAECIGSAVGYSFSGHQDEQTGANFITCDNTPGTCRHSLCQCDYALAVGIAERANEWREENDHLVGGFEMKQQCVGFNSRDWLHDEKVDFSEDGLRFDQKNILDFEDSGFLEAAATTFAPTTESSKAAAPLPNAENGSLKEKDTTTATAARNEQVSFNHFQDWANEKKEKMQCCGEYPERFPYQPKTGKACCNGISYNSYVLECCHGTTLRSIGTC